MKSIPPIYSMSFVSTGELARPCGQTSSSITLGNKVQMQPPSQKKDKIYYTDNVIQTTDRKSIQDRIVGLITTIAQRDYS